jgi:hypothetical protein
MSKRRRVMWMIIGIILFLISAWLYSHVSFGLIVAGAISIMLGLFGKGV